MIAFCVLIEELKGVLKMFMSSSGLHPNPPVLTCTAGEPGRQGSVRAARGCVEELERRTRKQEPTKSRRRETCQRHVPASTGGRNCVEK